MPEILHLQVLKLVIEKKFPMRCSIFVLLSFTYKNKKHVLQKLSEKELAEGCRKGDNVARKQLYEQYADLLMAVCMRYSGDRDTAQDILHDGFLKAFRSFGQFQYMGEGSLRAWLTRIMVNGALEALRKRYVLNEQPIEELPDDIEDEEDLELIPQAVLMQFIQELPDGYRTVFNLYVFEEKSHKEIAEILGITEHTSSSQFFRAKKLLMKKISEYLKREDL